MEARKACGSCLRRPSKHAHRVKVCGCNSRRRSGRPEKLTTLGEFLEKLSAKIRTTKIFGLLQSSWKRMPNKQTKLGSSFPPHVGKLVLIGYGLRVWPLNVSS